MLRPEELDDACQETLSRLLTTFRAGKTPDDPAKLPGYVHGFTRNVAMEFIRSRTIQVPTDQPEFAAKQIDPNAGLTREHYKRIIVTILNQMGSRDRDILKMLFLQEQDKSFICNHFNVTPERFRVLLHRAKNRFRKLLEGEMQETGMQL
jgi:RNA polymerase sigma factor (sigma-70 family)